MSRFTVMPRAKEWALWLIGWIVYPLIAATDTNKAKPQYHQARLAIRDWLHARPSSTRRKRAHELTRPPEGGW